MVTLNRPDAGNGVNELMAGELRDVADQLAAADNVRVVILTGTGPVFCVGREAPAEALRIRGLQAARTVADLPLPVVAAVNGDAADHGLELALAADLRVAASSARFWFSTPSAATIPFDGGTQRLPRLVGPAWARDMLLTGRKVSAGEALGIGLVNRVAAKGEDALLAAKQLAMQIAKGSPLGALYAKEAVVSGAELSLQQALGLEADLNMILQSTADRAEGIASFLERRRPNFTGE